MSDVAFADFTEQVLSLSYEQTLILMGKMLESLKTKRSEENYAEMEKDIARSSMNTMWEELKNDTLKINNHITCASKENNMDTPSTAATRSHYLDNLKVVLTVLVIAHHAMIPFVGGEGWPFHPSNTKESLPYMWHFLSTNAAFFMGLFFMISGYFVPKSFDRQGFAKFIGKKALRLLVPFAVISLVLSVASGTPESGHTWFLSSLFMFCLVYALIRLACKKSCKNPMPLSLVLVTLFAVVMGAGSYAIRQFYNQDYWIFLWVYKFEPVHYLQYIMMFAFGVMAGRGDWFNKMTNTVGLTSLIVGLLLCIGNYLRFDGAWNNFVYKCFGVYESLLCVFLCVGLVWLFRTVGNWNGKFWQWSAAQAYGAYIGHLFVLLIVENLLDPIWLGVAGKYLTVLILATAGSFVVTWLLRLIPGVKKVL